MPPIHISASLLSANFLCLEDEMKRSEEAGVHSFHLDIMDGHLAPNLSYGPPIVHKIRQGTRLPLDTHLMIDNPGIFLDDYIEIGADSILIHAEAYDISEVNPRDIKQTPRIATQIDYSLLEADLFHIKNNGVKAGITLNPGTEINIIEPILKECDSVLIMSVNPGYSGQAFIESTLDKIQALRSIYSGDIKVDGGINNVTAPRVIEAGANVLVTASYLYGSSNYKEAVNSLTKL
ncbi:MAG: ribulose-phosphate 3-epimerase [Candidatus Margulisbacteria bacterium]|nr:ribulose-phosphate 3-epimerase [Candidatus Margulisiibacteriota bacterium]